MSGIIMVPNGDLFSSPASQILVHGVNARGIMGAGVAKQFKLRFPESYMAYQGQCLGFPTSAVPHCAPTLLTFRDVSASGMRTGEVLLTKESGRILACLCSQYNTGHWAMVSAIAEGFVRLFSHFDDRSYAIPKIGCGIGGLSWSEGVRDAVHGIARAFNVSVYVYEGPGR